MPSTAPTFTTPLRAVAALSLKQNDKDQQGCVGPDTSTAQNDSGFLPVWHQVTAMATPGSVELNEPDRTALEDLLLEVSLGKLNDIRIRGVQAARSEDTSCDQSPVDMLCC